MPLCAIELASLSDLKGSRTGASAVSRKFQPPQAKTKPVNAEAQAKFQQGLALHQQGKFAEAERIYEDVLRQAPAHFDALHLLGVIALQTPGTRD